MRNRSSSEIIPAILDACIGGSRITNIMLLSDITHGQARVYLRELMENGWLEQDASEGITYTTTPEGLRYLHHQRTLLELLALA